MATTTGGQRDRARDRAPTPEEPVRDGSDAPKAANGTAHDLDMESFDMESLVDLLRAANRGFLNIVQEVMQQYPFPPSGMVIMAQIMKRPGSSVSQVARGTGFAKSHVSKTIDILVSRGVVEKRQDPSDRRVIRLFATEELGRWFEEIRAAIQDRLSEVLAVVPKANLHALVDGLEMVKQILVESGYIKPD